MPVYFFNVHDAVEALDEEGADLATIDEACIEAIKGLRCILAQHVRDGRLLTHCHISIVDEKGERLRVITFLDAVDIVVRA